MARLRANEEKREWLLTHCWHACIRFLHEDAALVLLAGEIEGPSARTRERPLEGRLTGGRNRPKAVEGRVSAGEGKQMIPGQTMVSQRLAGKESQLAVEEWLKSETYM